MNLEALKVALKRYGFDDEDPLDSWVNAAYQEILTDAHWPFLETIITGNFAPGQTIIAAPSDFGRVITIRDLAAKKKLDYVEARIWDEEYSDPEAPGSPEVYTITDLTTIRVSPVPRTTTPYRLFYESWPVDLTVGQSPTFPPRFHYIIVYRAAAIALAAENEEERSGAAMTEFATGMERMRQAFSLIQLGDTEGVEDEEDYASS